LDSSNATVTLSVDAAAPGFSNNKQRCAEDIARQGGPRGKQEGQARRKGGRDNYRSDRPTTAQHSNANARPNCNDKQGGSGRGKHSSQQEMRGGRQQWPETSWGGSVLGWGRGFPKKAAAHRTGRRKRSNKKKSLETDDHTFLTRRRGG